MESDDSKRSPNEVIDAITEGVLIVNPEGVFEFANKGAEHIFGMSRDEIVGRSFKEPVWKLSTLEGKPFPPEQLPYARVLRTREPVEGVRYSVERPDGRVVALSVSAQPLVDGDGRIGAIVATVRDITERVKAEDAVRASEQRFRVLVERIPDSLFLHDFQGNILDVNEEAVRSLGYSRDELLRMKVPDVELGWRPEQLNEVWQEMLTAGPRTLHGVHRRKDGSTFPVEVRIGRFGAESPLVLALARNVTERERDERRLIESEERYRSLVEASPDAIVVYTKGRITFANPAAVRLLGAKSTDQLVGRSVFDFVHPDSRAMVLERVRKMEEERKPMEPAEEKYIRLDGGVIEVELAAIPFMWEGTESVQVVARDVTQRVRVEQALRASEERYRVLFESNPLPMWVFDTETLRFLAVNDAAVRHYGYSHDEFLSMTLKDIRPKDEVPRLLRKLATLGPGMDIAAVSHHRTKDGRIINVRVTSYGIPFDGRPARLVLAEDVTELMRAEDELKEKDMAIRRAYVEVLGAVTGNRLVLMTDDEITEALGQPVSERYSITSYKELSEAREKVKEVITEQFPDMNSLDEFIVGVCEALTNAVKHAGEGDYQVFKRRNTAQVLISDHGPGIDFRNLPKATLVPGFSTRQTLGMGFTIMLELSDRLLLSTHAGGTTLVLEVSK